MMRLNAFRRYNVSTFCIRRLSAAVDRITSDDSKALLEEISKKEAVKKIYYDAFASTQGRPSKALLNALREHANIEGVVVSGEEIGEMEYEELLFQQKTMKAKVRVITGRTAYGGDMVNMYIDLYLRSGQLQKAHDVIALNRNIPLDQLQPALLWRYGLACQKAREVPKVELPSEVTKMIEIISLHEQSNISNKTHYTALEMLVKKMDQKFINDFLNKYRLLEAEFELIKLAIHSVDPNIKFDSRLEKCSKSQLYQKYPIIKPLEELSAPPIHPYKYTNYNKQKLAIQLRNEVTEFCQIKSIGKEKPFIPHLRQYKSNLRNQWYLSVYEGLKNELRIFRRGNVGEFRLHYGPFLEANAKDLRGLSRAIVNYFCEDMITQYEGLQVGFSARAIGNIIHKRYSQQFVKESSENYKCYQDLIRKNSAASPQEVWELLYPPQYSSYMPVWPSIACTGLGGYILNIVKDRLSFNKAELREAFNKQQFSVDTTDSEDCNEDKVFIHSYKISQHHDHNYPIGVLEVDPDIIRLMQTNMQTRGYFYFLTTETPMVCPPKPWRNVSGTPMLKTAVPFIRYAGVEWKQYFEGMLKKYDEDGSLDTVKCSLDTLGLLPWAVNTDILNLQCKIFNKGGSAPLSIAVEFNKEFEKEPVNATEDEMKEYRRRRNALRKEKNEKYAIRCTQLYTLSMAKHLQNEPFWQCYNMDFRGRVYAAAPHLNHLMGDPTRGLLLYDEGAPLGKEGLKWLKIHCINKFGDIKKGLFEEKVQYAEDKMEQILDSAKNMCPETGWWAQAKDDPWQCLATCIEISRALKSGDPESYVCRLPVHMDGSCNGLQHYAALGRDVEGAKKVNVYPSERPEDVYMAVVDIVQRLVTADVEAGDGTAKLVQGLIKRKTIKQTVMTQVYGVTVFGAQEQIKGRLLDQGLSPQYVTTCSFYLSKLTFKAVEQLFTQAQLIQNWLNQSARAIATSNKPVSWITPLGLPCVQPYMKEKKFSAGTPVQLITYRVPAPDMPVNATKQKSAFPPNFVHSQDSTHMMMTSIKCYQQGIPFAAVHDSFWTLPCHVTKMNEILREQFVTMYNYEVLKGLKESFEENFPDVYIRDLPEQGDLDINSVKDSQYFFS